jgi:hypothetical protein
MTDGAHALIRAVNRDLAGLPGAQASGLRLLSWETRPWASATFIGTRLRFDCGLAEPSGGALLALLVHTLEALDPVLPGYVLVDIGFVESRTYDAPDNGAPYTLATFEALVLEDGVAIAAKEKSGIHV